MLQINFADRMVSYETFMKDLAARVAAAVNEQMGMPKYVCQREAYRMFGRGNVERWRREGRVHPCKRPGKLEYSTAELRMLQQIKQDYF